ncbi:MAG: LPS assembly lipoprotein LptE [Planctomycetota bacterium]|nr:LPS assembly lipoprotein LptE [Planctomycetota bacterium]
MSHALARIIRLGTCYAALASAVLLLAGCGYGTKAVYPSGIRSVTVPIFENRSFYRGMERDLTEALIKAIELQTPYKAVARAGADTELTGKILNVKQIQLSRRFEGGLPQELEVRITLDYVWRDVRSGQVIRERKGFECVSRYVPSRPVGETLDIAQAEVAEVAAQAIVATMRSDW